MLRVSPLQVPGIDVDIERQFADVTGIVHELETAGTVEGVPVGGGGGVTSIDATGGVETDTGSPITSGGTIRGSRPVNKQSGTTYTYVTGDRGKLVSHSNASAIAATLPQAGVSFPNGWYMDVENCGAGTLTITPTTSTIDGLASLTLITDQGVSIFSDGTNYFTQRGRKVNKFSLLWQSESPVQATTHNRFYIDRDGVIEWVKLNVVLGDGTTTATIDVLKNGSSIYPSSSKPAVSAGSFISSQATPDTTSVSAGDYFQISVISTGNTLGALRASIRMREN